MSSSNDQPMQLHRLFFDIVNAVLGQEGRQPLPSEDDGPHRSIITVRDTDRVLQILAGPGSGKTEMLTWRVLYELLVRNNLVDFATLQKLFVEYQDRIALHFKHVFVDEFQDTNPVQFNIHTGCQNT